MPKKPIEVEQLTQLVSELVYTPLDYERKWKAKYWDRHAKMALGDSVPTVQQVMAIVKDDRIAAAWDKPNFKEWFRNEREFTERVEYLAQLTLDNAETALHPLSEEKGNVKQAWGKMVLEVGGKFPKSKSDKSTDAGINDMSAEQLREFILKSIPALVPELAQHANALLTPTKPDNSDKQ